MNKPIVPANTAIQTFRDSGYKNTASALAELLDNSIEAEAENIQVLTFEEEDTTGRRMRNKISQIAIYDDGIGMTPDTLSICLQFGNGTRLASRNGMGRFGIGLPNASVSQCQRVEVYSWRDGKCSFTYLDVTEIEKNGQQNVNDVVSCELPHKYLKHIEGNIQKNGTLIIWRRCDRLDITRARTLFKRMQSQLCRAYRHFLDTDDKYGRRRKFLLINAGQDREILQLRANDPLYLMSPNSVPGFEEVATNEQLGQVVSLILPTNSRGDTGKVEIRFSVAKPETQQLGGNSELGQHYRQNTGISFVRAAREIDFGVFGYFNAQEERHRWWGCEIRFEPEFDEVFGVTNNKQAVRGVNYLDLKELKNDHDDWEELIDEDPKLKLRVELSRVISQNLKQIEDLIKGRGKGTRSTEDGTDPQQSRATRIANQELVNNSKDTKSKIEGENKTSDEVRNEWTSRLLKSNTTLTKEDADRIAETKEGMKVDKSFDKWPGVQFFSVSTTGRTCTITINRSHPFYDQLYQPLQNAQDQKFMEALDLMLMAYARAQDELYHLAGEVDEINEAWGMYVKKFLQHLAKDA